MQHGTHIDEIIYIGPTADPEVVGSMGFIDLYSPRIAASFMEDNVRDQIKVLYACSPGVFINEIEFMLACKAKSSNKNYYIFEVPRKPSNAKDLIKILDKNRHTEYNIVSGAKIPENMKSEKKMNIYRYMMEGIHTFMVMHNRGVGEYITGAEGGRVFMKSLVPHSFQTDDSPIMNVSNVFTGMLIDYYRISSGVQGVDSQVSFMRNEQYRITVYNHMRDVFNAFVRNNTDDKESTDLLDGKELCKAVADILKKICIE